VLERVKPLHLRVPLLVGLPRSPPVRVLHLVAVERRSRAPGCPGVADEAGRRVLHGVEVGDVHVTKRTFGVWKAVLEAW
jgi:hypothetical protein